MFKKCKGFTLIELIIVTCIILVLWLVLKGQIDSTKPKDIELKRVPYGTTTDGCKVYSISQINAYQIVCPSTDQKEVSTTTHEYMSGKVKGRASITSEGG